MQIEIVLTGTKYYNGFPCLDLGGEVRIEFDEQNEYSDNAFGVFTLGGLRIGSVAENPRYIPRIITNEATKLSPELKQLLNDGYTIDKAVVSKIKGKMAVIEVTLNNPSPINEMEEDNMDKGEITVVGTKYREANALEGDIVRFKVVGGTTTLFNLNNEPLGVLPQSERKINELRAINAPIVKNREARNSFSFLEQCYTVINVVEDKYIFLREMEEEDLINTQTTKEEPVNEHIGKFTVLEELIAYDLMVKATNKVAQTIIKEMEELEVSIEFKNEKETKSEEYTFCSNCNHHYGDNECNNCTYYDVEIVSDKKEEDNMEINNMDIANVLSEDEILRNKVTRRNELINEAEDLKRKLGVLIGGIELLEKEIGERTEKLILINQIRANLEVLEVEELRKVNKVIINNGASSDEEDTTSSSNEEIIEEVADIEELEEVEEVIEEKTIPQKQLCMNCDECRFNPHSGLRKNVCFYYEHWVDDVLKNKESHFVTESGSVYKYVYGNGGFDNQRFDVEFEDRTIKNVGLWHRGTAPSEMVRNTLKKGIRK